MLDEDAKPTRSIRARYHADRIALLVFLFCWGITLYTTQPGLWFNGLPPLGEAVGHWAMLDDIRRVWQTGWWSGYSLDNFWGVPVPKFYFPLVPSLTAALGAVTGDAFAIKFMFGLSAMLIPPSVVFAVRCAGGSKRIAYTCGIAAMVWQTTWWWAYGGKLWSVYAGSYAATFSYSMFIVFTGLLILRYIPSTRNTKLSAKSGRLLSWDVWLGVLLAAIVLTHSIAGFWAATALVSALFFSGSLRRNWLPFLFTASLGVCLSAWWTIPALLEEGFFNLEFTPSGWNVLTEWILNSDRIPNMFATSAAVLTAAIAVWYHLSYRNKKPSKLSSANTEHIKGHTEGIPVKVCWYLVAVFIISPLVWWLTFSVIPDSPAWNQKLLGIWYLSVYLLAVWGISILAKRVLQIGRTLTIWRLCVPTLIWAVLMVTAWSANSDLVLAIQYIQDTPLEDRRDGGLLPDVNRLPPGRVLAEDVSFLAARHPAEQHGWVHTDANSVFYDSSYVTPFVTAILYNLRSTDYSPPSKSRYLPSQGRNRLWSDNTPDRVLGAQQAEALGLDYLALFSGANNMVLHNRGWRLVGQFGQGCGWVGYQTNRVCWTFWSPPSVDTSSLVTSLNAWEVWESDKGESFLSASLEQWSNDTHVWLIDHRVSENIKHETGTKLRMLAYDVSVSERDISFKVHKTGEPVLIRAGWSSGWDVVKGAGLITRAGPFMVVVPTSEEVILEYGPSFLEKLAATVSVAGVVMLLTAYYYHKRVHEGITEQC